MDQARCDLLEEEVRLLLRILGLLRDHMLGSLIESYPRRTHALWPPKI